jgi:hypothetical protein
MPLAGFEPTIPVFKRAKAFHALDRAATMTGSIFLYVQPNRNQAASDYGEHSVPIECQTRWLKVSLTGDGRWICQQ